MQLFDSHAHLSDPLIVDQLPHHLEEASHCCVKEVLSICTDSTTLTKGKQLQSQQCKTSPKIYLAAATGPCEVPSEAEDFWPQVEKAALGGQLHAIGEMGIDLYWETQHLEAQRAYFARCCALALRSHLPIVIHCRDQQGSTKAFDTVVQDLESHYLGKEGAKGVVFHCFSYGVKEMKILRARGIYVSITGVVTYKNASQLQEVAREVDSSGYLLETDAPYLTPRPRSKLKELLRDKEQPHLSVNRPSFLQVVAGAVASLRGSTLEQVAQETTDNTRRFLGISPS